MRDSGDIPGVPAVARASADEIRRQITRRQNSGAEASWQKPSTATAAALAPPAPTDWTLASLSDATRQRALPEGRDLERAVARVADELAEGKAERSLRGCDEILTDLGLLDGYSPWLCRRPPVMCVRMPRGDDTPGQQTLCGKKISGKVISERATSRRGVPAECDWVLGARVSDWQDPSNGWRCPDCLRQVSILAAVPAEVRAAKRPQWAGPGDVAAHHTAITLAYVQGLHEQIGAGKIDAVQLDRKAAEAERTRAAELMFRSCWSTQPRSLLGALGPARGDLRRRAHGPLFRLRSDAELEDLARREDVIVPVLASDDMWAAGGAARRELLADGILRAYQA